MSDTKDLLAQASAALDAERLAEQQREDALAAANVQLQAQCDASNAMAASLRAMLDAANATISSLQAQIAASDPWAAVDKTGTVDVTDKVQALIDKGLPVPAGKYLIDAVKGIKVAGALKMDPDAVLMAKPNGAAHYCIVEVGDDGSIEGGQILGDRDSHTYTVFGTRDDTHEWGHGLKLRNRAKASNVKISRCTGDGWIVVGDNVEARNIVSTGNRRQGCSVFASKGFRAYDCVAADTNGAPNGPCAGWDFEPDSGSIVDARLERCTSRNNRVGFLGWVRSEVAGSVDVTLVDCITDNNANGLLAKGLNGKVSMKVQGGTHTNRASGVRAETGSSIGVDGGTFGFVTLDASGKPVAKYRTPFTLTGTDSRTKYDLYVPTTTVPGKIVAGTNTYK